MMFKIQFQIGAVQIDDNDVCDNFEYADNDDESELPTNSFREAVTTKCIQCRPISLKLGPS